MVTYSNPTELYLASFGERHNLVTAVFLPVANQSKSVSASAQNMQMDRTIIAVSSQQCKKHIGP
jgi:hypothetical protein